jgi:hypothetical protein
MFYELRLKGQTNIQIGIQFGIKPHSVGSQVCQYRKKHKLPALPKQKTWKPTNSFSKIAEDEEKIREKNMAKAIRRKDGVLECPTMTCEGFGFDKNLDLER